ncbi:glycosyltransferase [Lacticaseibacillus sp. GG6-2]
MHLGEYVSGGVATYLQTLIAEQIADPKIDKIYLLMSKHKSQKLAFTSDKVQVVSYDYRRNLRGLVQLLMLWRRIVAWHPDVVHLHSSFAGLIRIRYLLSRPRIRHQIRIIYCAHGWAFAREVSSWKRRVYVWLERCLAFRGVRIINISNNEQEIAVANGFDPQQMTVIDNAISYRPSVRNKVPHAGKNFLFVGRFDRQKGLDVLLDAAALVGSGIQFKVIGAPVLDDEAVANAYPDNVTLLGWRNAEGVVKAYDDVDALIIPSRWEGFGLVALEAMAQHTAVIASRVGGLQDIVVDGETGLFFQSEDAKALATILETVTTEALAQMGEQGYERLAAHYNPQQMEQAVYALYAK